MMIAERTERVEEGTVVDPGAAPAEDGEYIEIFYNPIRRHSTLGGMSPAKFEEMAQTKEARAA